MLILDYYCTTSSGFSSYLTKHCKNKMFLEKELGKRIPGSIT